MKNPPGQTLGQRGSADKTTQYVIKKRGWNAAEGAYINVERVLGPLSIEQVRARVAKLPDSTIWLWTIVLQKVYADGHGETIGSVNSEEFDGATPEWQEAE